MQYWKISETWPNFLEFIEEFLLEQDLTKVGFMFPNNNKMNDIIIACENKEILVIIDDQYDLIPCEQPSNMFNKTWSYSGNMDLFDLAKFWGS